MGRNVLCHGVGRLFYTNRRTISDDVPKNLKAERIGAALVRLAETEDFKHYTHPEDLLTTMTWWRMFVWKERLEKMTSRNRLADRDALLAE